MKTTNHLRLAILGLIFCMLEPCPLSAQQNKRVLKMQELMWNMEMPESRLTKIPEKWQKESAVVLFDYRKESYSYDYGIFLNYKLRKRVKILDRAALEEFSQFSFLEQTRRSLRNTPTQFYFGIKVIKPDGQEIIVNTDEAIAEQEKEYRTQEQAKKIAIPNLQVGDMLDYFYVIVENHSGDFYRFDEDVFFLKRKFPTVYSTLRIQLNKKFRLNTRSVHGAPEFKNLDRKGLYIVEAKDIEKSPDLRWHYPLVQLPLIRYQVLYAKNSGVYQSITAASNEIKTEVSGQDLVSYLEESKMYQPSYFISYNSFFATIKKMKKEQRSPLEIADSFYDMVQNILWKTWEEALYDRRRLHDLNTRSYIKMIINILKEGGVPYDLILASPRSLSEVDDIISLGDILYGVRAKVEPEQFFFPPNFYTRREEIPIYLEGATVYTYQPGSLQKEVLPLSSPNANQIITKISLRLSPESLTKLEVEQRCQVMGKLKENEYAQILSPYEIINPLYKKQGIEFIQDRSYYKKKEREAFVVRKEQKEKDDREKRDENVLADFKSDWKTDEVELKNITIDGLGIGKDDSVLAYQVELETEGLVKKVGSNYLLNIGRMIGGQVDIEEDQKERSFPVEMPCARSFKHEIKLEIPSGYTVEGLDKLNIQVANSTGGFQSEAKMEGNTLIVHAVKYYQHNFEEAEKWGEMLAFLDAALVFYNQAILLKKSEGN